MNTGKNPSNSGFKNSVYIQWMETETSLFNQEPSESWKSFEDNQRDIHWKCKEMQILAFFIRQ